MSENLLVARIRAEAAGVPLKVCTKCGVDKPAMAEFYNIADWMDRRLQK